MRLDGPERLGLKAEMLLRLIHQQLEKGRPIPTSISLASQSLTGLLFKVRPTPTGVTLYTVVGALYGQSSVKELEAQVDAGDRWSSVLSVDEDKLERLRLTNKGGVVWLVSE